MLISVNGGPFQLVDPRTFIYYPYNMKLIPADAGFEVDANPRAGQPAFSGNDGGSFNGSWGTSIVDLTSYAHSGDLIRLRWDLSTDYVSAPTPDGISTMYASMRACPSFRRRSYESPLKRPGKQIVISSRVVQLKDREGHCAETGLRTTHENNRMVFHSRVDLGNDGGSKTT